MAPIRVQSLEVFPAHEPGFSSPSPFVERGLSDEAMRHSGSVQFLQLVVAGRIDNAIRKMWMRILMPYCKSAD
jgi:hypothetical protein